MTAPNGTIMYLLLPSGNPKESARFYSSVFGWRIRTRDDGVLAFEDSAGNMHGAWHTDMTASADQGFTLFIGVQDYTLVESLVPKFGGEIVEPADPTHFDVIGRFRDPFGNILGYYQLKEGDAG